MGTANAMIAGRQADANPYVAVALASPSAFTAATTGGYAVRESWRVTINLGPGDLKTYTGIEKGNIDIDENGNYTLINHTGFNLAGSGQTSIPNSWKPPPLNLDRTLDFGDGAWFVYGEIPFAAILQAANLKTYALIELSFFAIKIPLPETYGFGLGQPYVSVPFYTTGISWDNLSGAGSYVDANEGDYPDYINEVDASSTASVDGGSSPPMPMPTPTPTPMPQTVFLLHGIGQGSSDMAGLAGSLQDPVNGIDLSRFQVDAGFDFSDCAKKANCAKTCTIEEGATRLATYIKSKNPSGDIVLVGYSMGGLIARQMILKNYTNVLSKDRKVSALITLGTPNLGYPFQFVDQGVQCGSLETEMAGDLRSYPMEGKTNKKYFPKTFKDQQGNSIAALSTFLYNLNRSWPSAKFLPGTWTAIAGTFCENPYRPSSSPSVGCTDVNPENDGFVCEQSAIYSTVDEGILSPLPGGPEPYADSAYAHLDSFHTPLGLTLFGCTITTDQSALYNPPDTADSGVLQEIVGVIDNITNNAAP